MVAGQGRARRRGEALVRLCETAPTLTGRLVDQLSCDATITPILVRDGVPVAVGTGRLVRHHNTSTRALGQRRRAAAGPAGRGAGNAGRAGVRGNGTQRSHARGMTDPSPGEGTDRP